MENATEEFDIPSSSRWCASPVFSPGSLCPIAPLQVLYILGGIQASASSGYFINN